MHPPEQGPACPPPAPEVNWGWNRVWSCPWPLGCHTLGSLHPLCSQGGQDSPCPAQGSDTPALQGAQCPTCSSLWASSLSSIPKCSRCEMTSSGLPQEQGECLAHFWGSSSSQGQDANSEWQQRGEASPGSLLPLGKPLECEKRHLSCQGGQECQQLLCPAHPAGSQLSTCHAGIATLHTTEPTCPHVPARLSQAHWTPKGGSLNPSHALRSLKMLYFLS